MLPASHNTASIPHQANVIHLESLIKSLSDTTQRDDMKNSTLKEISENFDELTSISTNAPLLDSLIRAFLKLLSETTPQFISENNTLQLRKLTLELLLKVSTNECIKPYCKPLQSILLRTMAAENEDQALTILKILSDILKTFRPPFTADLTTFFKTWKQAYMDMFRFASEGKMFENQRLVTHRPMDEGVIEALHSCFHPTTLTFVSDQPDSTYEYSLIPRATQSVRVLAEMSVFMLFLIQTHRQPLFGEITELIPLFVQYINIAIPKHLRQNPAYNKDLADEFHSSQVRALTFIAYIMRHSQLADVLNENAEQISNGIALLLDNLHTDVINQRRDLLLATKIFFQCEMRAKFTSLIYKVTTDSLLIGSSFTSQDQLRNHANTLLADMIHHARMNLPYNVMIHIFFIAMRNLHDPQLMPYVQTMYGKVLMNFIEPLLNHGRQEDDDLCKDLLLCAIDAFIRKAKLISEYHIPLIQGKHRPTHIPSVNSVVPSVVEGPASGPVTDPPIAQIRSPLLDSPSVATPTNLATGSSDKVKSGATNQQGSSYEKSMNEIHSEQETVKKGISGAEAGMPFWLDTMPPLSLNDCKSMIRFIIQPIKTMVVAMKEAPWSNKSAMLYSPHDEAMLFSDLFVYGLKCLDIFMIGGSGLSGSSYHKTTNSSSIRSKEEKEAIEAFTTIFTNIDPTIFEFIIKEHIEFFMNRITQNLVLQSVCVAFFGHPQTAAKTGNVLVKYLLKKLPEMGYNNEKASLYLKMFKVVFNAVSVSQVTNDCENMLKPYLHDIVEESMQLALRCRESNNFFLLLRALFRSIGSGAHDLLYQQFLPLLPSILQQLNHLQNSSHRQPIHELFVELCLTVPVRLSSLLPYLPLLMDPLVSALYGSPTLVQQGLRTLELCVDNLQPEYFYDHMAPVRSSLMQGLWRTVASNDVQSALSAFRILGKFGGSSRKVLLDAQSMDYESGISCNPQPTFSFCYEHLSKSSEVNDTIKQETAFGDEESVNGEQNMDTTTEVQQGQSLWCNVPLMELVESATNVLRSPTGNDGLSTNHISGCPLPKLQALEIVKMVLLSSLSSDILHTIKPETMKSVLSKALENSKAQFSQNDVDVQPNPFIARNKSAKLFSTALTGLFFAVINSELRSQSLTFFKDIIRWLSTQATLESTKENFNPDSESYDKCMDATILVDAITTALADPIKDFCHTATAVLKFIIDTVTNLYGDANMICKLPFFSYLLHQISLLCYRREWYTRLGGCTALHFIIENYPPTFVKQNALVFMDAFLEVISGLADEVSSGALDFASKSIELLLPICFSQAPNEEIVEKFLCRLIEHLDDPETLLREESVRILNSMSSLANSTITTLLKRKHGLISSMLANKMSTFAKLSVDSQIGVLSFYCFMAEQKELGIDISSAMTDTLMKSLMSICSTEDNIRNALVSKLKSCSLLTGQNCIAKKIRSLRCSAIKSIACRCSQILQFSTTSKERHDADDVPEQELVNQIVSVLVKNILNETDNEVRDSAVDGIRKITSMSPYCANLLGDELTSLISDFRQQKHQLTDPDFVRNLAFLNESAQPKCSQEDTQFLNEQVATILGTESGDLSLNTIKSVGTFLRFLCQLRFIDVELVTTYLKFFAVLPCNIQNEVKDIWLQPLLEFVSINAENGIADNLLSPVHLQNSAITRLVLTFLKQQDGGSLRKAFMDRSDRIAALVSGRTQSGDHINNHLELEILNIIYVLLEKDATLFQRKPNLYSEVRNLWKSASFRYRYSVRKSINENGQSELMDRYKFDVPCVYTKIMILQLRFLFSLSNPEKYFEESIELTYDLMYAFCHIFVSDFSFLRIFIDEEITPIMSLRWRREAFKKVVKMLKTSPQNGSNEQLVRFMQYIVAPCFHYAFEKYDADAVVGGSADPEHEDPENVVSLLCTDMIKDQDRDTMSDSMTIVMYQFCVLFVQKCPAHIHDMSRKQQGSRLRLFMLFGWPCLQAHFNRDTTEKYAGHLLIANIIDKFAINRKIVLQVLNSLLMAHHQDHKEVVRKALDILVPAVPRRMDDGYDQLFTMVKKLITEESRNTTQVTIHCLTIIIRHYKVFYFVRHQLASVVISALQRLLSIQFGVESRKIAIEICEVMIKWAQECQKSIEQSGPAQTYSSTSTSDTPEATATGEPSTSSEAVQLSTVSATKTPTAPSGEMSQGEQLDKSVVDNVILLLLRIATSSTELNPGSSTSSTNLEVISKRSVVLLRMALKPNIFGNIATLKPQWFEKQLSLSTLDQYTGEQPTSHQLSQAQVSLDVLSNIIGYMQPQTTIDLFRPLQRSLIGCLNYSNSQIVRSAYNVVSKLIERTSSSPNGLSDFDMLSQYVAKHIHDAFAAYYSSMGNPSQPTLMTISLLRVMCSVQPQYLDSCLASFLKMMQRLVRDHINSLLHPYGTNPAADQNQKFTADLLYICLEMICPRIHHISIEAKKSFTQYILVPLIDKNAVDKVVEMIIKAVNEFLSDPVPLPGLGITLLSRMTISLENRLLSNSELLKNFLYCVLIVFEKPHTAEDALKLNTSFFWGLCCTDKAIRSRYFAVLEKNFPKDFYGRLLHIMSKENWQSMGTYFWITHVIHLMLLSQRTPISTEHSGVTSDTDGCIRDIHLKDCATLANTIEQLIQHLNPESEESPTIAALSTAMETNTIDSPKQEVIDSGGNTIESMEVDQSTEADAMKVGETNKSEANVSRKEDANIESFVACQRRLLSIAQEYKLEDVISNIVTFVHYDWKAARNIFIEMFRSFWRQFNETERERISAIAQPFLASAIMLPQKDAPQSVVSCFLEAFVSCEPPINFRASILKYIASSHNCWHLILRILEGQASNIRSMLNDPSLIDHNEQPTEKLEILDQLAQLYTQLNENDQFSMVWKRRAYFDKTMKCLSLLHQGEYSQAREMFEKLMNGLNDRLNRASPVESLNSISPSLHTEVQLWEKSWVETCKELNDWSTLQKFSNTDKVADCNLLMDSAWHLHDWHLLNECIVQVDACGDPKTYVKSSLYKVMNSIINSTAESNKLVVEESLTKINKYLIAEWRRLPSIVGTSHLGLLRDAHLVHEVGEASNILQSSLNNEGGNMNNSIKHVMKSWRSRPLTPVDAISSWLDIFNWRYQHYQSLLKMHECNEHGNQMAQHTTFLLHSLAQSQLNLALSLRRSNQIEMALNALNTLHTLPSIHPMDAQLKVYEHVKCLLKLASNPNGTVKQNGHDSLYEALHVIENTQLQFLKRDQIARLMITKGIVLSKLDKREEAGRAFTTAAMLDDSVAGTSGTSVWKHWGKHIESIFLSNHIESTAQLVGIQAVVCFLECAKSTAQLKARGYLSRVLWLFKVITSCGPSLIEPLEDVIRANGSAIPPANWLFWINEMVADIRQRPGKAMVEILCSVAETYPQQVFPILRVNLDVSKILERSRKGILSNSDPVLPEDCMEGLEESRQSDVRSKSDGLLSACDMSASSWSEKLLCIVDVLYAEQPSSIITLNNILQEFDNFPISPAEARLHELKSILQECHYESFTNVTELPTFALLPLLHEKILKLVGSIEEIPDFMISQFKMELTPSSGSPVLLHQVASTLRLWTSLLMEYMKKNQRQCVPLRSASHYLSNFKSKMAQIDVFSGPICPRIAQYSAQISQFMPIYHTFVRHDSICRVIMIRSLNGKVYPYFFEKIEYHATENYVPQLFSMLNTEFSKDRGTCQRLIQFTVPQVLHTNKFRMTECCSSMVIGGSFAHSPQSYALDGCNVGLNLFHMIDVFDEMLTHESSEVKSSLEVVDYFYKSLLEQRYCHKTILDIFHEISVHSNETVRSSGGKYVPKNLFSKWIASKYLDPSNLWIARKKLSVDFAVLGLAEYTLYLSSMNLDNLAVDLSTSQIYFANYHFDLSKKTRMQPGRVPLIELDANRPVAFRMSANIAHFLDLSIEGHFSGAVVAVARCLGNRAVDHLLRPILWDVFWAAAGNDANVTTLINPTKEALETISNRIKSISHFDGQSNTNSLLISSQHSDNLCRMDPTWHPWF